MVMNPGIRGRVLKAPAAGKKASRAVDNASPTTNGSVSKPSPSRLAPPPQPTPTTAAADDSTPSENSRLRKNAAHSGGWRSPPRPSRVS
jgi:hypothetical protein